MAKNILAQLPDLSFRGIAVPCVSIQGGFSHDNAQHKFVFRDDELIESLGRRNITLSYGIPFHEELFKTPQPKLFTVVFPQFLEACRDRTTGILVDPVLGELPAKVTQFEYTADPNRLSGIDVHVEFVHAPAQDALPELDVEADDIEGSKAIAKNLDNQVGQVDWHQETPPEPFLDPFSAVSSVFDQVSTNIDKVARTMDNIAFKVNKMNDSIDRVADVRNWPVQRSGQRLKASAQRTKERVAGAGRPVRVFTTTMNINRGALAASLHNTLGELITLNPRVSQSPVVKARTQVRYYAA